MEEVFTSNEDLTVSEDIIRIPVELPSKPITEIEYEYNVELDCLKEKLQYLEKSIDGLIQENIKLRMERDEVEAIKLQISLSERIREDLKVCKALEIENQEIRDLIFNLCNSDEIRGMIKFRNKEMEQKYQANPSVCFKIDEIDLFSTYKKLVNFTDVQRSDNIFLKIELGRLREVFQSRASAKSEYTILNHEVNRLKDMMNLSHDRQMNRKLKSSCSMLMTGSQKPLSSFSSLSSAGSRITNIENPFKISKQSLPKMPSFNTSPSNSIKSARNRLEEILQEGKEITSHLKNKVAQCSAKREARYNPPSIYCKYYLKNSS